MEWIWVGGRAGTLVACLIGSLLFLRDSPSFNFVLGCIIFATFYDSLFLLLLLKNQATLVFLMGLMLDTATLLAAWWAIGDSQSDVRTTNDLYLILFPVVLIGVARFGWLLGALYASLWLIWLSWSTFHFYGEGSYEAEQLPLRLLFLGIVSALTIYLIARLSSERRHADEIGAREKERSELLQRMEARFRYMADSSSDAMVIASSAGILLAWNTGAERIFGHKTNEALGKSITELMPEKYRGGHIAGLHKYLTTGQSKVIGKTIELEGIRKTGEVFPLELSIAAWDEGKDKLFGAIMRDVSERKKLEAEYLQSQKLEIMGRMVSAISHDFNNFLTPISGFALLGKDSPEADAGSRAYFEHIADAAEQAHNLSNQLLQMASRQASVRQTIDINKSVTDISILARTVVGRTVDLNIELDDDPQFVNIDPVKLQQVLMNLIVNAKDAMPDGGRLTLSTAHEGEPDHVHLSVIDSGTGMTDEVKARLFEPFFTTKPMGKGTGLGLAICYQIIKDYGGRISVESQPGKGTAFHIFIPRHAD